MPRRGNLTRRFRSSLKAHGFQCFPPAENSRFPTPFRSRPLLKNKTRCPGEDSNLHGLLHQFLRLACIPISPPGHWLILQNMSSEVNIGFNQEISLCDQSLPLPNHYLHIPHGVWLQFRKSVFFGQDADSA